MSRLEEARSAVDRFRVDRVALGMPGYWETPRFVDREGWRRRLHRIVDSGDEEAMTRAVAALCFAHPPEGAAWLLRFAGSPIRRDRNWRIFAGYASQAAKFTISLMFTRDREARDRMTRDLLRTMR